VYALRRQAKVANDGDFGLNEGANEFDTRAFDFDGLCAGFFYKARGVGNAFSDGAVVAAKRHVDYDEGTTDCAVNGAGVVKHFVHGNGERVFVAEDDHGEGVSDEQEIDAGLVGESCA
jgi:hypothetical protein